MVQRTRMIPIRHHPSENPKLKYLALGAMLVPSLMLASPLMAETADDHRDLDRIGFSDAVPDDLVDLADRISDEAGGPRYPAPLFVSRVS